MAIVDQFVKEAIEPLSDIGSPEKVLNKKWENWTPEDIMKAYSIFREGLEPFVKKKLYEDMVKGEMNG
jgi:hypothetical protein